MKFSKKLKLIRKTEGYTQIKIGNLLRIAVMSVQRFEKGEQEPRNKTIKKLCNIHPEYAYWLMTDEIDPPNHIDSYIKCETKIQNYLADKAR